MSTRTSICTGREWIRSLITTCCNSHVLSTVDLASVTAEMCLGEFIDLSHGLHRVSCKIYEYTGWS